MNVQMTVASVAKRKVAQEVKLPNGSMAQASVDAVVVQLVSDEHGSFQINCTGADEMKEAAKLKEGDTMELDVAKAKKKK